MVTQFIAFNSLFTLLSYVPNESIVHTLTDASTFCNDKKQALFLQQVSNNMTFHNYKEVSFPSILFNVIVQKQLGLGRLKNKFPPSNYQWCKALDDGGHSRIEVWS